MTVELVLKPVEPFSRGRFRAFLDGRELVVSRQPLLDGARALLAEGYPPDTIVAMRHEGSSHFALRSVIGKAAGLTVIERDRGPGPVFSRWNAHPASAVPSPMRFDDEGHPDSPQGK